jgi:hypothetical protein
VSNSIGVQYVTFRRPVGPGPPRDYGTALGEAPECMVQSRHISLERTGAILGIYIVEDECQAAAQEWLDTKAQKYGWSFDWHDSYTVAEAALHNMEAAEQ